MAYTPINWQTGDTITAEKLNRCDNGWSVGKTQLFSETVTTEDDGEVNYGEFTYSTFINADNIVVTFDGTDYTCNNYSSITDRSSYGATEGEEGFDFSTYPFCFFSVVLLDGFINEIITSTPGEHTVAVAISTVQTSTDFDEAASAALGGAFYLVTSGVTTWQEIADAIRAGKVVYRYLYEEFSEYAEYDLITSAGTDGMGTYQIYYMTVKSNGIYTGTVNAASANSPLWFY